MSYSFFYPGDVNSPPKRLSGVAPFMEVEYNFDFTKLFENMYEGTTKTSIHYIGPKKYLKPSSEKNSPPIFEDINIWEQSDDYAGKCFLSNDDTQDKPISSFPYIWTFKSQTEVPTKGVALLSGLFEAATVFHLYNFNSGVRSRNDIQCEFNCLEEDASLNNMRYIFGLSISGTSSMLSDNFANLLYAMIFATNNIIKINNVDCILDYPDSSHIAITPSNIVPLQKENNTLSVSNFI